MNATCIHSPTASETASHLYDAEVALPKDKKLIAWITASLAYLKGYGVKEALAGITTQGVADIGSL